MWPCLFSGYFVDAISLLVGFAAVLRGLGSQRLLLINICNVSSSAHRASPQTSSSTRCVPAARNANAMQSFPKSKLPPTQCRCSYPTSS